MTGHRFDYNTPIEETVSTHGASHQQFLFDKVLALKMQALHDVVQAGYVRYIGMSSCYAYQCAYILSIH